MKHVEIYTDGACRGNPGRGGWGAVLVWRGIEREMSGGEAMTTNNRMELTAAIEALAAAVLHSRPIPNISSMPLSKDGRGRGRLRDGKKPTVPLHSIPIYGKSF